MPDNFLAALPVLRAASIVEAQGFYCDGLGFSRDWIYQPSEERKDPAYMGLSREAVRLHVSSFSGDGSFGGVANIYVRDVDALFRELAARGIEIALEPVDQTWGNREMYVRDPDGNTLRFIQVSSPA